VSDECVFNVYDICEENQLKQEDCILCAQQTSTTVKTVKYFLSLFKFQSQQLFTLTVSPRLNHKRVIKFLPSYSQSSGAK
jgi:hypothetical protein